MRDVCEELSSEILKKLAERLCSGADFVGAFKRDVRTSTYASRESPPLVAQHTTTVF
jgi:hypothetical protein